MTLDQGSNRRKSYQKGIAFGDEILFSTSKGFSIKGLHKRKEKNKLHFLSRGQLFMTLDQGRYCKLSIFCGRRLGLGWGRGHID